MEYQHFGGACYLRVDRGDEIIASILDVCEREGIRSATFSGIGGCSAAEIQVFDPESGMFSTDLVQGMLELVSLMGNVIDGGERGLNWHAHALFAYCEGNEHRTIAGHLKSATVLYTAEIELRPVSDGVIKSQPDPETGTAFWAF